jgi:hypothetical protein
MRMGRYWLVAAVIGSVLTFGGANEVWLAWQERQRLEMSLDEYLAAKPPGRWVKLTGCRVAYPGTVYVMQNRKTHSTPIDVTVPVYASGASIDQPVQVVLVVNSSRAKEVVKNPKLMGLRTETIEGVVRGGTFGGGMNEKLKKIATWKPAESHIVIDEGRAPSLKKAAVLIGIGGLLLTWVGTSVRKRFGRSSLLVQPLATV